MIKRVLLCILLAWTAIAPAIASSCAAECETGAGLIHTHAASLDTPDCHGDVTERPGSSTPDEGSMELACSVASAASLPSSFISIQKIAIVSEQHAAVLLPRLSFETSAPTKPPQA